MPLHTTTLADALLVQTGIPACRFAIPNRVVIVINACNQPVIVVVKLLYDAPEEEP